MNLKYSLSGQLLVASSAVINPFYTRGVCLVVHQDDKTTAGVMLNRPMRPDPEALQKLLGVKQGSDEDASDPVPAIAFDSNGLESSWSNLHFGGPLAGPVVAVHQDQQLADTETAAGVYVSAQRENLEQVIQTSQSDYRLIVGHLQWQSEQVFREIDAGVWHQIPAFAEVVFSDAQDMWPNVIRRATSNSLARWLDVPDMMHAGAYN
ncbi:MAG: YqgE/AlgH family protein [Planctomycetota bacterium]